jgi:hypothetical protein
MGDKLVANSEVVLITGHATLETSTPGPAPGRGPITT